MTYSVFSGTLNPAQFNLYCCTKPPPICVCIVLNAARNSSNVDAVSSVEIGAGRRLKLCCR